jgi:DNA-binding CsgD family transcriptional regulator
MLSPSPRGSVDDQVPAGLDNAGVERERRSRARAGIAAIDRLLEILDERHLMRQDPNVGLLPRWRRTLEATGLVIPPAVSGAATTPLLHERLLDWQVDLLAVAYPARTLSGHALAGASSTLTMPRMTHPGRGRSRRWVLRSWFDEPRRVDATPSVPPASGSRRIENPHRLTNREVTVLRVMAEGLSNAQIAARLDVSEHTVAAHLRSIFRKIGAASRSAATRYAFENGLA